MNRKQLIFLLAAFVIIGGAGLILFKRDKESWSQAEAKMGDKVLPDFQPNDVAAIHFKGSSELNLVHKNDVWSVPERYDYPANFHQISDLLIKLKNLKVVESDTVDPSELGRVDLGEPGQGPGSGTLVEFKDSQGKVLESVLVGKKHMRAQNDSTHSFMNSEPDGCYILLPKSPGDVMLISDPLTSLQAVPEVWLNKDFIKIEKMKSCALASLNPSNSWKISRESESADWVLADAKQGEELDSARTRQMANTLAMPRFTEVFPATNSVDTGLGKPRVLTIETFDNFAYTIKIGGKSPEGNYYLTVDVTADLPKTGAAAKLQDKLKQEQSLAPWIYTVGSWIMDPALRDRAQLLQGYKEEDAAGADKQTKRGNTLPGDQTWRPRVIQ